MNPKVRAFARRSLWALPVWALMLFLGTLTHQPDPQTEFPSFANYVTTNQFLISHLVNSILGAAIGIIGVVGLVLYLQNTRAAGRAITGMVLSVLGNVLNTSLFGVAAFAQPALGQAQLAGEANALEMYNRIYAAPLFGTALVGMLAFITGGIVTGIAIAASGRFPRWAGWAYAIAVTGFSLSLLFFTTGQSIMSALLIAATLAVAWTASRRSQQQEDAAVVTPSS